MQVAWVRAEDQTILSMHTKLVTHNSRIGVTHDNSRTWRLRIRQLKESDRGCYMCQINTSIMKIQQGCLDVYGKFISIYIKLYIQTLNTIIVHAKPLSIITIIKFANL